MIDSYISPSFPFSLIYFIQNYLVVNVISYISYKRNFINKKIFISLIILSFVPLLLNNSFVSWTIFPDQSKYLFYSRQFRLLNFENFNFLDRVQLSSAFYSLFFIFNIQDFNSLAFINRLLINLLIIYLVYKKFNKFIVIFFLFYPSIVLYSGLGLRETLVIFFSFFLILFLFQKKIILIILLSTLIYIIKVEAFYFILVLFLTTFLYQKNNILFNRKIKIIFLFIIFFIILLILINNLSQILYYINKVRLGYYSEQFGNYKSLSSYFFYEPIAVNFVSLITILKSLFLIFFDPIIFFPKNLSFVNIILSIDNIILLLFLYYYYKKILFYNKNLFLIYSFILIFFLISSHLIIFNLGSYLRQKFIFCTIAICFFEVLLNNKKN